MFSAMTAPIVGRRRELHVVRNVLGGRDLRDTNLIMLAGDAGIGKTRIMVETARLAEGAGYRVHWSQMIEDPATPPYFAWTQLLRSCMQQPGGPENADQGRNPDLNELANILPELRQGPERHGVAKSVDGVTAQFRLHDSVSRFLIELARQQPVVLLFDNLHLADASSLQLLEHFCQQLQSMPALVIAAYRDIEIDDTGPLRRTVSILSRMTGCEELVLNGLTRDESATLLHAYLDAVPPSQLVDQIFEQSDGNPLFVTEVGRLLSRRADDGALPGPGHRFQVPATLRELITARFRSLPETTLELLAIASVLGRDFDIASVAALSDLDATAALRTLDPALSAGIIAELANRRFRFHHATFREVLYKRHGFDRRIELHRKTAQYLEGYFPVDDATYLSQIAHHYSEAVQPESADKAVTACCRAAEHAFANRAYREAAGFYDRALQALELSIEPDAERRFRILFELGRSQFYAGQNASASNNFLRASILAYRHRWWHRYAEATLEFQHIIGWLGVGHVAAVSLHQQAIAHIADDPPLLARLTASLSRAHHQRGERDKAECKLRESIAMARASGDASALLFCLRLAQFILIDWETADKQLDFHREAIALATEIGDPDLVLDTKAMILVPLGKLGEVSEIEALLAELEAMAAELRHPYVSNVLIGYRTALAILRGDWENATRYAQNSVRQASLQGVVGLEGRLGFQMFAIYKARGDLRRVGAFLKRILMSSDDSKLWLPGLVLLHCELGQHDQARAALQRLGRISDLPRDDLHIISLVYLAEACRQLQDRGRIAEIYDNLYPNRDRTANLPGHVMLGAISGHLAILAAVLHKSRQARELFEHALEFNRRIGAGPELARCSVEYAAWLSCSEYDADRRRARLLIAEATPAAKNLDLKPVLARIDDLRSLTGPDQLTRREIDILERITAGASNKQIAADLEITHSTVATHVGHILKKTGATNRTEAVRFARRTGVLARF